MKTIHMFTKNCPFCKKDFQILYKVRKRRIFCSRRCSRKGVPRSPSAEQKERMRQKYLSKRKRLTCAVCHKDFYVVESLFKRGKQCCSRECWKTIHHFTKICQFCGKEFKLIGTKAKDKRRGKFCNRACMVAGKTARPVVKLPRGYIYILSRHHPFANSHGYVMEHRLVAEKILGRFLQPEETIHHINEITSDNRPENLYRFDTSPEHTMYHRAVTRGEREPITKGNLSHRGWEM